LTYANEKKTLKRSNLLIVSQNKKCLLYWLIIFQHWQNSSPIRSISGVELHADSGGHDNRCEGQQRHGTKWVLFNTYNSDTSHATNSEI